MIQVGQLSFTGERMCTKFWLSSGLHLSLPGKCVVKLTDHLDMTIVVDWDVNQQNKRTNKNWFIVFRTLATILTSTTQSRPRKGNK